MRVPDGWCAGLVVGLLTVPALVGQQKAHQPDGNFDGVKYLLGWQNVLPQQTDRTCGAAVIASLARWQGQDTTEKDVSRFMPAGGRGLSLQQFAVAAQHYGLRGQWFGGGVDTLRHETLPLVVHLQLPTGHFAILTQSSEEHFVVADPLNGNAIYPARQFKRVWSGRFFRFKGL